MTLPDLAQAATVALTMRRSARALMSLIAAANPAGHLIIITSPEDGDAYADLHRLGVTEPATLTPGVPRVRLTAFGAAVHRMAQGITP
jgi:hypothetical protein